LVGVPLQTPLRELTAVPPDCFGRKGRKRGKEGGGKGKKGKGVEARPPIHISGYATASHDITHYV